MKRTAVLLLLTLAASILFAQSSEKPLISVLDFKASDISKAEVELFVDFMTTHIVETGKYRVLDRSQRQAILEEIEFSTSDCTDERCQLEIGRLLAANQIIVGSLGRIGGQYILNIKLLDVQTGEALSSASEVYASIDDLVNDSKRLTYHLLRTDFEGEEAVAEKPVPEKSPVTEEQSRQRPAIRRESGEYFNAVFVIASFEFWDKDLYLLFNYSRNIIPFFGLNVGAGMSFINTEFTVLGGVFFDFSNARIYANVGYDDWVGLLVTSSFMLEIGRFCVLLDVGISFGEEDFRLGAGAGYLF